MRVGLLIAIERELKAFLESEGDLRKEQVNGRTVYRTEIGGNEVFAVMSGYGEIDAAAGTQLLITKYGCDAILNFGVTGALDPALRVEDLFVVRRVRHYDFDVSPIDPVRVNQYPGEPDEFMAADEGLISLAKEVCPELREATVASGDRFVEDKALKRKLREAECGICDMEIAAITRVCRLNDVRCLSIKCISDTYDGDGGDFEKNVEKSAKKAFEVLKRVIEKMA